jgi:site-specific DNA-methyltransferase (adenine-specific)
MEVTDLITITNEDNMQLMARYPDNYFDLAIVDPPYNIKIDDWDNIKEYENYVRCLVAEICRVLKRTGTMYFFGSAEWIATCKIIIDEFDFGLRSWIIWDKGAKQQNSTRSFADVTEHCLHFTKPKKEFDNNPVANYLNKKRIEKGLSLSDINRALGFATNGGGVASSYMGNKPTITIPSENHYNLLIPLLDLDKTRDELLLMDCKYTFNADDIRIKRNPKDKRTYKNDKQICTNVFYNQNGKESGESEHPTAKPVDIIRTLIRASSNKNDIVLSPFIGSGSDAIACHIEGRYLIGCELDNKYFNDAVNRIKNYTKQLTIFDNGA